jgi:sucrose-6-phosphate hydrolase SacC (GH32 family)
MIRLILTLFFYQFFCHSWAQIAQWSFNEQTGATSTQEIISGKEFTIQNHFARPEFINAPHGSALRLDGWSTWLEEDDFDLSSVTTQFSVEVWYATEAYAPEFNGDRQRIQDAAVISQINDSAGFALTVGSYGNPGFSVFLNNTLYELNAEMTMPKYQWNHLIATIDSDNSIAHLYLNGQLVDSLNLPESLITIADDLPIYLGRHSIIEEFADFNLTILNGSIDEVTLFDRALSQAEIRAEYELISTTNNLSTELQIDAISRHQDYLRPRYHAMPNATWANEPYGLTYYNGKYHLFFQKNPNAPMLWFMHWGHLFSPDLVNWSEERIVLAPDPGFDEFGVWSGTTIMDENDRPVIFYTGVDIQKAGIGMAFPESDGLVKWTKYEGNPVIPNGPSGFQDFRDPFLWKDNGFYYMIVGAGYTGNAGGILPTYKSTDLTSWERIDNLYSSRDREKSGYFWEMPFFFKLNDQNEYILGVNPLFTDKGAELMYWIGKWENEHFTPYFEEPKYFDPTHSLLLAPALGLDEDNRITYIGIIPETRSSEEQVAAGWRQTFSLPKVIRLLNDSTIGHYPHPNLCRYRTNEKIINDIEIANSGLTRLAEFGGNQVEFEFLIDADSNSVFDIRLLESEDGRQHTKVVFDLKENVVGIDTRQGSATTQAGRNRFDTYVFDHREEILVQIFVDRSVVEVFIDNLLTMSARVYPNEESSNISINLEEGGLSLIRAIQWDRLPFGSESGQEICEPETLPDSFRKLVIEEPLGTDRFQGFNFYPNPTKGIIQIGGMKMGSCSISDINGRVVFSDRVIRNKSLDLTDLSSGIYFLHLNLDDQTVVKRIIIER